MLKNSIPKKPPVSVKLKKPPVFEQYWETRTLDADMAEEFVNQVQKLVAPGDIRVRKMDCGQCTVKARIAAWKKWA